MRPGGSGMLTVVPEPVADTRLGAPAGARIERPLVGADEQDARIVVEDRLRSIAMMGVEVEDPHPLAVPQRGRRNDGDVGHQAEAHRVGRGGVMARRTDGAERRCRPRRAAAPPLRSDPAPAASTAAEAGLRARRRVGVDPSASGGGEMLETIEIPRRMDALEIGSFRRLRFERNDRICELGLVGGVGDRCEP